MEKYIAIDNIDAYYEQVVKRKMSPASFSKLIIGLLIIAAAIFIMIYLMVTVADWLFLLVLSMMGFAGYMVYYLIKNSHVEYEYTFVLGELRIAKIKGNSKRRTITYFDVKAIDDIGHYIDPETGKRTIDPKKYPNLLRAAENEYNLDTYYFIIHDKVRKKPAVLLMTPNAKTMSLIRPYLSVELKKKFLKMQKEDELIQKAIELTNSKGKTAAELGAVTANLSAEKSEAANKPDNADKPEAAEKSELNDKPEITDKEPEPQRSASDQKAPESVPAKQERKPRSDGNNGNANRQGGKKPNGGNKNGADRNNANRSKGGSNSANRGNSGKGSSNNGNSNNRNNANRNNANRNKGGSNSANRGGSGKNGSNKNNANRNNSPKDGGKSGDK